MKNSKQLIYKNLYIIFLVMATLSVKAQVDHYIETDQFSKLDTVAILIDNNYSFQEVLSNDDLEFTKKTTISVKDISHYWIKCNVATSFAYDKRFSIWTNPMFDSELYYFDEDNKKWQSQRGGYLIADFASIPKYISCIFKADEPTTIYIKVNVKDINHSENELETSIYFQNESIIKANLKKDFNVWLITIAIVLAFLMYNLYWYVLIREKVYLYYLIILIGGIVYITSSSFFMHYFVSVKSINAVILTDHSIRHKLPFFIHTLFGAAVVIFGFVQFTRAYLKVKNNFPKWDKFLKYSLLFFLIIQVLYMMAEYFRWINPSNELVPTANNLIILFILVLILIIGFKGYTKKTRESIYFLKALFLPIIIMLGLLISMMSTGDNTGLKILPNLAILSITITFAIALVAKVNLIKKELSTEKFEKQSIVALNEIEKERNLRLEEKIEYNKNEVAAAQHIKLLMKELHHRVKNNLQIVSSLLSLQSFRIKDQKAIDAVKEGQHRIEAMSLIHQKLYIQDNITQVDINEFITDIAESLMQAYGYDNNSFQLQINVNQELLDVDKAIPLSIIINELITNAFKYAYTTVKNPKLSISFSKQKAQASLTVEDNGIGINIDDWKTNDGYGKELIQTFTEQLEGTLSLSVNKGTLFKIVFPF